MTTHQEEEWHKEDSRDNWKATHKAAQLLDAYCTYIKGKNTIKEKY